MCILHRISQMTTQPVITTPPQYLRNEDGKNFISRAQRQNGAILCVEIALVTTLLSGSYLFSSSCSAQVADVAVAATTSVPAVTTTAAVAADLAL